MIKPHHLTAVFLSSLLLNSCCSKITLEKKFIPGKEPVYATVLSDSSIFVPYDKPPDLLGGFQFVKNNLKYPEKARQNCIQASVIISAVIDESGKTSDVYAITDDKGWGFNNEAIELVKKMTFIPASNKGAPIKCRISFPIVFKLR